MSPLSGRLAFEDRLPDDPDGRPRRMPAAAGFRWPLPDARLYERSRRLDLSRAWKLPRSAKPRGKAHAKALLVIAPGLHPADGLGRILVARKVPFHFVPLDALFAGALSIRLERGRDEEATRVSLGGGVSFGMDEIGSVLWAGLGAIDPLLRARDYARHATFYLNWRSALDLLVDLTATRRTFPGAPGKMLLPAQDKLADFALAQKLGFSVPPTLVSNDPRAILAFAEEHGPIVAKRMSGACSTAVKQPLTEMQLRSPRIKSVPTLFQKLVDKRFDYRVVVVGERVFACRIHSQEDASAVADWRLTPFHRIRFEPCTLPGGLQGRLVSFARAREFRFATFDLIEARTGAIQFLEMNRPGSLFFNTVLAAQPIYEAIVEDAMA